MAGRKRLRASDFPEDILGDESDRRPVETWLVGLTILAVSDFRDGGGQVWRELRLSDGHVVQWPVAGPWLVLSPGPDLPDPDVH